MDNNKKTRRKINAFDVFLVLLVLCLIATFGLRIYNGVAEDNNSYKNEYVLTFSCENVYDSVISSIKDGEAVYLSDGQLLGYITKADNSIMSPFVITSTAKPDNAHATPFGTIELELISFNGAMKLNGNAKRVENGDYFVVGDDNVTEGSTITVYTEKTEFTITVVSITKVDNY